MCSSQKNPKEEEPPVPSPARLQCLLIGINYRGSSAQLSGCINDVQNVREYLRKTRETVDMLMLTDDTRYKPTRSVMLAAMDFLVDNILKQPEGKREFHFHYSGHGSQVRDVDEHPPTMQNGQLTMQRPEDAAMYRRPEEDGLDETMVPIDYLRAGQITDDTFYNRLVVPLRGTGARGVVFLDMCHSGSALDLPYSWNLDGDQAELQSDGKFHTNEDDARIVMISGCRDSQTSSDVTSNGRSYGAFTESLLKILQGPTAGTLTWRQLMHALREEDKLKNFTQLPVLSSTYDLDLDSLVIVR